MAMFRNGPGSPFPVGTNPVSNATADLNGDGHLDLLTANYISDNVSVLFGDGHGGFIAAAPVPVGNGPRQIQSGLGVLSGSHRTPKRPATREYSRIAHRAVDSAWLAR